MIEQLGLDEMWTEQREREQREQELDKERERAHREKMARLEMEKASVGGRKPELGFELNRASAFMLVFDESVVDVFLEMVKKVAVECEWPEEKWPLSVLTGKAQRAVAALDDRVGLEYDALRKAVLEAYGSVPRAYRRQFRQLRRQQGDSYLDLWQSQAVVFDQWIKAWQDFDYQKLKDLVLLEHVKQGFPRRLKFI